MPHSAHCPYARHRTSCLLMQVLRAAARQLSVARRLFVEKLSPWLRGRLICYRSFQSVEVLFSTEIVRFSPYNGSSGRCLLCTVDNCSKQVKQSWMTSRRFNYRNLIHAFEQVIAQHRVRDLHAIHVETSLCQQEASQAGHNACGSGTSSQRTFPSLLPNPNLRTTHRHHPRHIVDHQPRA